MPAQLLSLTDGKDILLDKPVLLFGRHLECDIQLNSRKISRRHCCIAQVGTRLVIRDLGSTNGIRINGQRVLEGDLRSGDELTIGNFRFTVYGDAVAAPPSPIALDDDRPKVDSGHFPNVPVFEDDEMLESSDDPVPLKDPASQPKRPPAQDKLPPALEKRPPAKPRDDDRFGLVLPEDIDLAPASNAPSLPDAEVEPPSSHDLQPSKH